MSLENQRVSNHTKKDNIIVMGVDILPGKSSLSKHQPHYAIVILSNGEVVDEYEDASLSRLIRIAWEVKPEIIAIDNIYELAPDYNGLVKIVSMLPPNVRLIQVTGWGPQAINIRSLAKNLGIPLHGKLTPLKTAYVAAVAAYRGYGYQVKFLEEKTRIIVSKGRSISRGGMSYNRYIRSVRAGILSITKEIKKILDANKLDYDLVFRKSKGGLESSVFIVYAPRSRLYGLIKPINTKNVRVEIKPVYSKKISTEPLKKARKPVILGLDPGINTGIAVIDLNGMPLFLYSSKNIDRSEIINMVSSIGKPVLIATDVSTPPEAVKKLAASLNVQIYSPPRDLSNDEKNAIIYELLKKYPWLDIEDAHERDALAAAYKAYLNYTDKFKQIESEVYEMNIDLDIDNIKAEIIRGKTIAEAIEEEVEKKLELSSRETGIREAKQSPKTKIDREVQEKEIATLKKRIQQLVAENKKLKNTISELQETIHALKVELSSLKNIVSPQDNLLREINKLRIEKEELLHQINALKKSLDEANKDIHYLKSILREVLVNKYIVIPTTKNLLSYPARLLERYKSSAIYVNDLEVYDVNIVNKLYKNKIAILTSKEPIKYPVKIPILNINNYRHYFVDNLLIIESRVVKDIENAWKKIEEDERRRSMERIIDLIMKYKEERKKKLGVKDFSFF